MTYQIGSASHESLIPRINLAIGPSCPVRCEGCYNKFDNSNIVPASEVVEFAQAASELGIKRSIVSGGDPLSHPGILEIMGGLSKVMDHIRLDTVGTSFLPVDEVPIVYKGRGFMDTYHPAQFAGLVSLINIPRDGFTEQAGQKFRRGRRSRVLEEGELIAGRITEAGIPLGINTVVNRYSLPEIPHMLGVVKKLGANQWRLFQFDPVGPNPSRHAEDLSITEEDFISVTNAVREKSGNLAIFAGSLSNRGTYHMVDSAGNFYERTPGIGERAVGHITHNREAVLDSLRTRIATFYPNGS